MVPKTLKPWLIFVLNIGQSSPCLQVNTDSSEERITPGLEKDYLLKTAGTLFKDSHPEKRVHLNIGLLKWH